MIVIHLKFWGAPFQKYSQFDWNSKTTLFSPYAFSNFRYNFYFWCNNILIFKAPSLTVLLSKFTRCLELLASTTLIPFSWLNKGSNIFVSLTFASTELLFCNTFHLLRNILSVDQKFAYRDFGKLAHKLVFLLVKYHVLINGASITNRNLLNRRSLLIFMVNVWAFAIHLFLSCECFYFQPKNSFFSSLIVICHRRRAGYLICYRLSYFSPSFHNK